MVLMTAIIDLMPGHPIELEATLTLRPKQGVHVVARRRP